MSVVSSVLSTRSTGWRINVRFSSLMDSIFAIGFGLGLRFVVDAVSHHDFKLTGTLVGLWEGVIMLHFLKKMPKSSDPYIAYGVRLFIDFLFTESLARTVLVLIWTALGMVLADITPAIWDDVGLKRIWRGFRRDLYTISRMIPTVAFFPPTRTVRFSPSQEPSIVIEATEVLSPSDITIEQTPITNIDPTSATAPREVIKRRVPGYFPVDFSDTETDSGSVRIDEYTPPGRTSRRLSVYPQRRDSDDTASDLSLSQNELDEGNLSSLPSDATETGEPQSALPDASEIPEMQVDEEPLLVDVTALPVKPEDGELTPTQRQPIYMPPTPSDSAVRWFNNREVEDPLPIRPPSELLPQIPDFLDEATTEDWEKIRPEDYEKPPTPPAKDKPAGFKIPKVPGIPPPVPPTANQSRSTPPQEEGWDTLDSQFISPHPPEGNATADPSANTMKRQLQPPYEDVDYDDIYDDPLPSSANDVPTGNFFDDDTGVPPAHPPADTGAGSLHPLSGLNVPPLNPWGTDTSNSQDFVEKARQEAAQFEETARLKAIQEEEETKRRIAEEATKVEEAKKQAEEEEAKTRIAEEAAKAEEAKKQAEEEANKQRLEAVAQEKERRAKEIAVRKEKRALEKAEIARKELDDEIVRKKRAYEAEQNRLADEAEKKRLAQIKKDAEEAQLRRVEAARKKAEEEEKRKKTEEEEEKRKKEEEEEERRKVEEDKKVEEEKQREEAERKQEVERKQKEEREEAARVEEERKQQEIALQKEKEEAERIETDKLSPNGEVHDADVEQRTEVGTKEHEPEPDGDGLTPEGAPEQNMKTEPPTEPLSPTELSHIPVGDNHDDQQEEHTRPLDAQPLIPDNESVVTEASEVPGTVRERLEKLLSWKAQIANVQTTIHDLKQQSGDNAEATENQRAVEKSLRKLLRKESRRHESVPTPKLLKDKDANTSVVTTDSLTPREVETKIEEKLEALLIPGIESLSLEIKISTGQTGKKQVPNVTKVLNKYKLLDYTTSDKVNTRHMTVDVPSTKFKGWLTAYWISVTRSEDDEEDAW